MKKEHPIIFSGEMVRAILDGRKTQTRRVIHPQPHMIIKDWPYVDNPIEVVDETTKRVKKIFSDENMNRFVKPVKFPYGEVGNWLWVRENAYIALPNFGDDTNCIDHRGRRRLVGWDASMDSESRRCATDYGVSLTRSVFMPRWASRITLEITGVRVERVQEITYHDLEAEGMTGDSNQAMNDYILLWDRLNAKRGYSWASNPWVWVIEFRRVA